MSNKKEPMWVSNDLDTIHFLLDKKGWGKRIKDDAGEETGKEDVRNVLPVSLRELKYLEKNLKNAGKHDVKTLNSAQKHISELRRLRGENWDDDDVRSRSQIIRKSLITTFKNAGAKSGDGKKKSIKKRKKALRKQKKKLKKKKQEEERQPHYLRTRLVDDGRYLRKSAVVRQNLHGLGRYGPRGPYRKSIFSGKRESRFLPSVPNFAVPSRPIPPVLERSEDERKNEKETIDYLYDILTRVQQQTGEDFTSGIKKSARFAKSIANATLPQIPASAAGLGISAASALAQGIIKTYNSKPATGLFEKLKKMKIDQVGAVANLISGVRSGSLPAVASSVAHLIMRHPATFVGMGAAGIFGNSMQPIIKSAVMAIPRTAQDMYNGQSLMDSLRKQFAETTAQVAMGGVYDAYKVASDVGDMARDVASGTIKSAASGAAAAIGKTFDAIDPSESLGLDAHRNDYSWIHPPSSVFQPIINALPTAVNQNLPAALTTLGGVAAAAGGAGLLSYLTSGAPSENISISDNEMLNIIDGYREKYKMPMFPSDKEIIKYKKEGQWPSKIPNHSIKMLGYSDRLSNTVLPAEGYNFVQDLFETSQNARSKYPQYNVVFQYRRAKKDSLESFHVEDESDLKDPVKVANERNQLESWNKRMLDRNINLSWGMDNKKLREMNAPLNNFEYSPKVFKTRRSARQLIGETLKNIGRATLSTIPMVAAGVATNMLAQAIPQVLGPMIGSTVNQVAQYFTPTSLELSPEEIAIKNQEAANEQWVKDYRFEQGLKDTNIKWQGHLKRLEFEKHAEANAKYMHDYFAQKEREKTNQRWKDYEWSKNYFEENFPEVSYDEYLRVHLNNTLSLYDKQGEGISIFDEKIGDLDDDSLSIINHIMDLDSVSDLGNTSRVFMMERPAFNQADLSMHLIKNDNIPSLFYNSVSDISPNNMDAKYTMDRASYIKEEKAKELWSELIKNGIPLYMDGTGVRFGNFNLPSSISKYVGGFSDMKSKAPWDVDLMRLIGKSQLRPGHIRSLLPTDRGYIIGGIYKLNDISKIMRELGTA